MRRSKTKGRAKVSSSSPAASEARGEEIPALRDPQPAASGGPSAEEKSRKTVGVLGFIVVVALAAAVVVQSIALSNQEEPAAALEPDSGPAEATAIDQDAWLVRGEIDPDEGLFICENGVSSATTYGNDLILICRE